MKKVGLLLALVTAAVTLTAAVAQAETPTTENKTIVPYLDTGYKHKVVPKDGEAGFEKEAFDDSSFSTGDAAFGIRAGGICPLESTVRTNWPTGTSSNPSQIVVRKSFDLPPNTKNLKVGIAIDNDAQVFINGRDVSSWYEE